MDARENWLRAVEYRHPEWIPCSVGFSPITWRTHGKDLEKIVLEHPRLWPNYDPGKADFYDEMPVVYREGEYYTDNWGCTWLNIQEGLEGQVVGHPLADWSALATYRMPDPLVYDERGPADPEKWDKIARHVAEARDKGQLIFGNGERLFDRLYFLRGFENLMTDFATEPPELARLIGMLEEYEMKVIHKWLELRPDVISFHTDFGTQHGPMISPASFRKYIKPLFQTLFQACRRSGVHVFLSSDGNILPMVDDLIECGVSVHDPQLRACTLEGIVKAYKGKLCACVDLDRQAWPFV
ncbi:MAG: hypothetical protein NUW23_15750, partial [Firmicutes bacterium]|nr:hypothetical protein [Bacillota bacterium]